MAIKIMRKSLKEAIALVAALGGFEDSNAPVPVRMGHMEGEGDQARWVVSKEPLTFRGDPVYQFDVRVLQISPLNGAVRSDVLHVQFPSPKRPSFEDMVPADGGMLETD